MIKKIERNRLRSAMMKRMIGAIIVVAALIALMPTWQTAQAQEMSESHLNEAKRAIIATNATVKLNDILPRAATTLTERMISNRPDIDEKISQIVNETALELAPRRGDLEKEVAKIYARVFSEAELVDIGKFFDTDTGKKFLEELPLAIRQIDRASRIWGTGINRDLVQKVNEKMRAAKLQ